MAPAPIVLAPHSESTPLATLPYVSILPFRIAYDGPAPIKTYFPTRPLPSPPSADGTNAKPPTGALEATFRGRLLVSTPLPVPAGFTGLVFSTSTPVPPPTAGASTGTPAPASKKAKVVVEKKPEGGAGGTEKTLIGAPSGARRSPRKRKPTVLAKFSMDSDDEADEGEGEPSAEPSEVEVLDLDGEGEEEIVAAPEPPPSSAPVVAAAPLVAQSSLLSLDETPATPISEAEFQSAPELKRDADAASLDAGEENSLARDVQLLIPRATFDTVQIWHADFALDTEEDTYARTLTEWFSVAEKVHAY